MCKTCESFQGYALLCVGFPSSDIEVETQDEDEVISDSATMILLYVNLSPLELLNFKTLKLERNFYNFVALIICS